jgi:hypothetical protein
MQKGFAMPESTPPSNWEEEFFKKHNITDEAEKKAIRGRSVVMAYDRARQAAETAETEKNKPKERKWYDK